MGSITIEFFEITTESSTEKCATVSGKGFSKGSEVLINGTSSDRVDEDGSFKETICPVASNSTIRVKVEDMEASRKDP